MFNVIRNYQGEWHVVTVLGLRNDAASWTPMSDVTQYKTQTDALHACTFADPIVIA
jgi:hypothetical protein